MCDARTPETGAITHPTFLDALLRYLRENYEDLVIYVVESDATVVIADKFIHWLGYMPILERWGAKWHNLSRDDVVNVPVSGYYMKEIAIPAILTRSCLVSFSKLKTNTLSTITASLKNQFGCMPMVQKSVFHDHLAEVIADVNRVIVPSFSIVDGIIAMGGSRGPAFGVPIRAEVILTSRDPVAVDSASAALMGIRPSRVKHIRLAAKAGIGSMDYQLVGDEVPRVDFELSWLDDLQFRVARALKRLHRARLRTSWKRRYRKAASVDFPPTEELSP
jgi:uncharacterized protein (DUF362 family)